MITEIHILKRYLNCLGRDEKYDLRFAANIMKQTLSYMEMKKTANELKASWHQLISSLPTTMSMSCQARLTAFLEQLSLAQIYFELGRTSSYYRLLFSRTFTNIIEMLRSWNEEEQEAEWEKYHPLPDLFSAELYAYRHPKSAPRPKSEIWRMAHSLRNLLEQHHLLLPTSDLNKLLFRSNRLLSLFPALQHAMISIVGASFVLFLCLTPILYELISSKGFFDICHIFRSHSSDIGVYAFAFLLLLECLLLLITSSLKFQPFITRRL